MQRKDDLCWTHDTALLTIISLRRYHIYSFHRHMQTVDPDINATDVYEIIQMILKIFFRKKIEL